MKVTEGTACMTNTSCKEHYCNTNTFKEEPEIQHANSLPTTSHKYQDARNFHQIQTVSQGTLEINSVYFKNVSAICSPSDIRRGTTNKPFYFMKITKHCDTPVTFRIKSDL